MAKSEPKLREVGTGLNARDLKKKKLEDALIILDEVVKVKVGPSKIHGVGLIAMRDIKKGEKLYTDALPQMFDVPYKLFKKLRPDVREHILGRWPQIVNGSHFMSDGMLAVYLNHQEGKLANYDAKKDKALRNIKEGEEITENYKLIENYQQIFPWLND